MSNTNNKSSRRDVLKRFGGMLGGVSLLGHGTARGQAQGSLPSGYTFYRVLRAKEGGRFGSRPNVLGDMTGSVMLASPLSASGIGYVYLHGMDGKVPSLFEVAINFGPVPPVVERCTPDAIQRYRINVDGNLVVPGHIGTGACNALGEYVTTIEPVESSDTISVANSPGVYLYRPHGVSNPGTWSRVCRFGDTAPDGSLYGGDFGDLALDNDRNLLLAAATTHEPDGVSGFGGSQALIATSLGAPASGRVVLQTGDMLPFGSAVIESVGLVDLAPNRMFAAQVSARSLDKSIARSGTALITGNTQGGQADQKLVAASPELMPLNLASQRNIVSGQTFFGPRVDRLQDVAFVTHDSTFVPTIGSNDVETLGYYSRGSAHRLEQTNSNASDKEVIGLGAPCIDSTGLMYGTELLGDGSSRLFVSDGRNSKVVLESREFIQGRNPDGPLMVTEILFGQHSTQVDAFGRLVFVAEFLLDPKQPTVEGNVITALVIGIPK